jgi:phosphoglycolate phosphatase-like HAD superfamily hydrolase
VVQLLVDGVPNQFAALLHDLRIDDEGALPIRTMLRNLADRPPTEHRQLLNNSLADIIERALSTAADELPDEAIDEVLESVAGYRSRLGL